MKKLTAVLISLICLTACVSANAVTINLDGKQLEFPVEPFITEGTTFVPMRVIFEALGAEVDWNGETRTVTSSKNGTKIEITIDSADAYKNGLKSILPAAPVIVDDYTMVPLRFISESFGCDVDWNGDTQTVTISTENPLENSIIGFIGDSICSGGNFEGGYARVVSENYGITAVNEAQGGGAISRGVKWDENSNGNRPSIIDMFDALPDTLGYVIMQGGLNDFWGHAELGTVESTDELTYCGALNALFKKAREDYPDAKLGFIITHNAFTYNAEENFEPWYEATKTVCDNNGVAYLDLYAMNNAEQGVNVKDAEMKKTYFETDSRPGGDGVHPNRLGYEKIYAEPLILWLKTL